MKKIWLILFLLLIASSILFFVSKKNSKDEQVFIPAKEKITIKGDEVCQNKTVEALNLLKVKSPESYKDVESYIGIIECAPAGSGVYANENPPRFLVGNQTRDAGVIWYAGSIVHDAHHSMLYNQYFAAHKGQHVPAEIWTGKQAEQDCINVQYKALEDLGADQATLDYLKNTINTNYWETENRTW